jgi:hypothetical protein
VRGFVNIVFCQTVNDSTPAVCQKDSRIPAAYHNLGSQMTAKFGQRPNANAQDGFILSFTNGEDDLGSTIHFVWYCALAT